MDRDDRTTAEHLLRNLGPVEGQAGALPDEELIAGYVEDRLPDSMREAVERMLLKSPEGRALASELAMARESGAGRASGAGPRRRLLFPLAIAAALLVAVGVGLWGSGVLGKKQRGSEARLVAAAEDLVSAAPDLFEDFRPLDAEERAGGVSDVVRGGLTLLSPRETVLSSRPLFRWLPVQGATTYRLAVLDEAGTELYTRNLAGTRSTYGAGAEGLASLERGKTYVWEVTTEEDGPLAPASGRYSFTVASAALQDRFARARALVGGRTPDDLQELVLAHLALRWDMIVRAQVLVDAHLARHPDDPIGRETREHVRRRLGLATEAE